MIDNFYVLWSILAFFLPTETNQKSAASFEQMFEKMKTDSIDFRDILRIEDLPTLETKNSLNLTILELKVKNKKHQILQNVIPNRGHVATQMIYYGTGNFIV